MSRPGEEYQEWISAEVDGELSAEERTVLHKRLLSDPEAQRARTDMIRLAETLRRVEEVEPPADLSRSIMAALPPAQSASAGSLRTQFWFVRRPAFKYAYALAAGVLLGFVLNQVVFQRTKTAQSTDLYGSMAPRAMVNGLAPAEQLKLNADGLTGSVRLGRLSSRALLEFDLELRENAEVTVRFDAASMEFNGYNQELPGNISLTAGSGRISLKCERRQHFTLSWTNRKKVPVTFTLDFLVSGKLVQSGTVQSQ